MTKTRIAVLGAGFMGGTHARAYRKRDDEAEMRKHVDPTWRRELPRW